MPLDQAALVALLDAPDAAEPAQVALGRAVAADQAQAFDELARFLGEHQGDLAALDVAAGVVRGIAQVAPLAAHPQLYRALLGANLDPTTIRAQPIKVLALALAVPGQDAWVRLHGRRLLRRLWELRTPRGLTPDVTLALEDADVAWELAPVETLDDAWEIVRALCTTDPADVVSAGGLVNVWEVIEHGAVLAGDAALAGFVHAQPGAVESRVLERLDELAATPGHLGLSVLDNLFEQGIGFGPSTWTRTHAAWDAALGMQVFAQAHARGRLSATTAHNSFHVAASWLRRDPRGYAGLAREMVDAFHALLDGSPLPDILPAELDQQSPNQIEQALADYCGITIPELYQRLLPGALCTGGFIQPGTELGWLIKEDAETLRSLGISRHELADRLAELIPEPDQQWHEREGFQACALAFMGHQRDPFHTFDVYGVNGHLGAVDFRIVRGDRELAGGTLQLSLIRRACLFGGPGCYRIDPANAAVLLGLA